MISWLTILDFPNYEVSSIGTIRSFTNKSKGKLLKIEIDKDGYSIANLSKNGKIKKYKIHRLVGKYFLPNDYNLDQINHKNGNKQDNRVENLEWVNHISNQRHAWKTKLKTKVLTPDDVYEIRFLLAIKQSNTKIAKMFNVNQSTISNIKTGKTWSYLK